MSRLTWEQKDYSAGVDRGALYFADGEVVPWNGLISVDENTGELNSSVRYLDGRRIVNRLTDDAFTASVDCYTYPERLDRHRGIFDMSYRSAKGSGHEIHLIYNALARVGKAKYVYNAASSLQLDIATRPRPMPLLRAPSAHVIVDTSLAYPPIVDALEDILYGTADVAPRLPNPEELAELFDVNALFQVVDNGDGTATLTAPEEVFHWLSETHARVDWPYVNQVDEDTVRLRNF